MLKKHIKPHLMLSGQLCRAVIAPVGGELDSKGQPCPAVISGEYIRNEKNKKIDYLGAAVTLAGDKIRIDITNKDRNAVKTEIIDVMEV